MATSSIAPMPSATTTRTVWPPGRSRPARPWRHASPRTRGSRRVATTRIRDRPRRTPIATAAAPTKIAPRRNEPACQMASAASPAAIGSAAAHGRRARQAVASTSRRRISEGGTLRTASSGQSAQSNAVSTPSASPRAIVHGSHCASSGNGANGARARASTGWIATPSPAPTRLPSAPTACVWTR